MISSEVRGLPSVMRGWVPANVTNRRILATCVRVDPELMAVRFEQSDQCLRQLVVEVMRCERGA